MYGVYTFWDHHTYANIVPLSSTSKGQDESSMQN
jgi:hypothetical protein